MDFLLFNQLSTTQVKLHICKDGPNIVQKNYLIKAPYCKQV